MNRKDRENAKNIWIARQLEKQAQKKHEKRVKQMAEFKDKLRLAFALRNSEMLKALENEEKELEEESA